MTMTCDEFEKAVLAEPLADSEARGAHAEACPGCAELLQKARRLERRLGELMAVPVPAALSGALPEMAGVAQRADGDNVVAIDRARKRRAPVWFALAASVALVGLLTLRQTGPDVAADDSALVAELIEHIGPELGAMRPSGDAVAAARVQSVMAAADASLDGPTPLVSYAKTCVIDGEPVPHLVMQGAAGPVTLLVLPSRRIDGPLSIMQDGLEGVVLPVGDGGSIAIIGRDAASVEAVRAQAAEAVGFAI